MIGIRHWQGPQKQGVKEAEGRGAGADGESERQDGCGGGDFVLLKLAQAEDGVGAEGIEPGEDAEVVALIEMAEWRAERLACFGGVAALVDGFLDVGLDLFVDVAV